MSFTVSPASEVEKVVLGACLLESEPETELAISLLEARHFSLDSHQRVWRRIVALHAASHPINTVTVMQELMAAHEIESVGGAAYVADLTTGVPRRMGEQVRHYAERVKEFWRKRELLGLGERLATEASDDGTTSAGMIQNVSERLESIADDNAGEDADISASIVGFLDRFYAGRKLQTSPGMSYGLPELDSQTGGMMPGEQTAVGAVSGVGKTAFMAQGIWATLQQGYAVDAFLLEPTRDQITARLISLMTGVPYGHIVKPYKANIGEERAVTEATARLAELPFRMFGRSSLTLDELLGHARVGMRRRGTRLICTDYIQRLKIRQTEKDEPVRLRVGRASTALADLVKDTQTHSMLLSQITTGRKGGVSAVPTMFDFRESSQIENDAHSIILLHRQFDEQEGHYTNTGAILVPKQRNGVPCNLRAWFDPVTAAWSDREPKQSEREGWQDRRQSYV